MKLKKETKKIDSYMKFINDCNVARHKLKENYYFNLLNFVQQ